MKQDSALLLQVHLRPDYELWAFSDWKFPNDLNWCWQTHAVSGLYLLKVDSV